MKNTTICAALILLISASDCFAANNCGPIRRMLNPCGSQRSCRPSGDQPSELNILLTTELVALREQVEEMKAAAEAQQQTLEQTEADLAAQQAESEELVASTERSSTRRSAEGIEDDYTDPTVFVCEPGSDADRTRDANITTIA